MLKIIIALSIALFNYIIKGRRPGVNWRGDYRLSDDIVWLLYYISIFWVSIPYFPYLIVVMPFLLLGLFKFFVLNLRKFKKKPLINDSSHSLGFFIMLLVNLTFSLIIGYYGFMLYYTMSHSTWKNNSSK